jgi:hypothetical protein
MVARVTRVVRSVPLGGRDHMTIMTRSATGNSLDCSRSSGGNSSSSGLTG